MSDKHSLAGRGFALPDDPTGLKCGNFVGRLLLCMGMSDFFL